MPARLQLVPTIHKEKIRTVNLGTTSRLFKAADIGKAVKLIGPGQYDLCAAGDKIEGIVTSSEYELTGATRGGLSVGGIVCSGYVEVVSTAALAAGDIVVAAAQPALGTPIASIGEGEVPCTPVQKGAGTEVAPFLMRIVDLGPVGTGAAGTVCVAEFL
jgi:hypothetical protein